MHAQNCENEVNWSKGGGLNSWQFIIIHRLIKKNEAIPKNPSSSAFDTSATQNPYPSI